MKPRLPDEIAELFPVEIVRIIHQYVPPSPKQSPKVAGATWSPNMDKDLKRIQHKMLSGKNEMFMRDLDDFILK
jgi:hypothetical protein